MSRFSLPMRLGAGLAAGAAAVAMGLTSAGADRAVAQDPLTCNTGGLTFASILADAGDLQKGVADFQYTEYYDAMLAFPVTKVQPFASSLPVFPAKGTRKQKADWRALQTKESGLRTRTADRIGQDLQTNYDRAGEDAKLNLTERRRVIEQNFKAAEEKLQFLDACQQFNLESAYVQGMRGAEDSYNNTLNAAQGALDGALRQGRDDMTGLLSQSDAKLDAGTASCAANYRAALAAIPEASAQLNSVRREDRQVTSAKAKVNGTKKKAGTKSKLTKAKKQLTKAKKTKSKADDKKASKAVKSAQKAHSSAVSNLNRQISQQTDAAEAAVQACNTAVDRNVRLETETAANAIDDRVTAAENAYAAAETTAAAAFQRAAEDLDRARSNPQLALPYKEAVRLLGNLYDDTHARSDRANTDEVRDLEDAFTRSRRALEDYYEVDFS